MYGFILMNLFLFGFTKTKTGAKITPRVPKLSYFDGPRSTTERRPPGVIGHILTHLAFLVHFINFEIISNVYTKFTSLSCRVLVYFKALSFFSNYCEYGFKSI